MLGMRIEMRVSGQDGGCVPFSPTSTVPAIALDGQLQVSKGRARRGCGRGRSGLFRTHAMMLHCGHGTGV